MADLKVTWRRFRRMHLPDPMIRLLREELKGMDSVLDVGCGSDSPLQFVPGIPRLTGVDAFLPSLEASKARGIHQEYIHTPLEALSLPPRSYDAVVLLDLIEHFEKQEGLDFLKKMEAIAAKKILVFTPNGFLPQPPYENNPWQLHRSGWTVREFDDLGYRVYGVLGLKSLRGAFNRPRFHPWPFWERVANLSRIFTAKRPDRDAALLAVKE
ncbi:MAG: class I SAM-dependent methyltransferase [candidate division FCPU426 bacterium]